MFDKIPSLKDFIIYVIPGVIICFFGIDLFGHIYCIKPNLRTQFASNNSTLIFIGIIFSFLIGFLSSQISIIVNGCIWDFKWFKNRLEPKLSQELIRKFKKKMDDTFDLPQSSANFLDSDLFELCENYVKQHNKDENNIELNRMKDLSTFSIVSFLPIIITIIDICFILKEYYKLIIVLIIILILVLLFIPIIYSNFKRGWKEKVYRQFYVLTTK